MPDTMSIYTDLKEQGLILSQGFDIGFPPIRPPKQGLIGQLTSYVMPLPKFEESADHNIVIVPILSNCFVIGRCNTLLCYKY